MDTQSTEPADWLAQTKLHPPLLREDMIARPRLVDRLHQALTSDPLTLVSAPAGYGKTTFLASLGQGDRETGLLSPPLPLPLAWLTLDEGDNDPARFLTGLVAALQQLNPACGAMAQTLLAGLANPAAETPRIIGVLINDVLEALPAPFALILDDLHLITEPAVFGALDHLLTHLPPQMHLAVGTRHDPPLALPRLRARGQLTELRLADLCFILDETTLFLNDKLRLNLSAADLTTLQDRTEGWPAGLRLLATSLDRIATSAGRTAFIQDLAQTDRNVFDFLAEEVLNRQPPEVRTFLLEASILSELTPARCQVVTGRDDAPAILEDVYHRNLFLVALDPVATTFRYHALFGEFLRQRLAQEMPGRVRDLHRRAAETQADPGRAIRHYLAAEMWEPAAQTIEKVAGQLLRQGLLDTLSGWIRALPTPVCETHPRLFRFLGGVALWRGEFERARALLERAVEGFVAVGDEAEQGEALADLASTAFLQADFARASALINRALMYPVAPRSQALLLMERTWLRIFSGDWAQAAEDLEAAVSVAQKTGRPEVLLMLAFNLKPGLAALPGGLEQLERFCYQATAYCGEPVSPLRAAVEELMAFIHFWRGRVEEAIRTAESALAINERLGHYPFLGIGATSTAVTAYVARGDYAAADRFFTEMFRQTEQMPLAKAGVAGVLYLLGRARWLQACAEPFDAAQGRPGRSSRLEEARDAYVQMCAAGQPHEFPEAPVLRARMRGLLEMADRRYGDAERVLRQALALEGQIPTSTVLCGSTRLLLAYLYLATDRPDEALAEAALVLAQCERQGTPGLVLQEGAGVVPVLRLAAERGVHATYAAYLLDLLGVTQQPRPVHVPDTGETLTPREVEVLRLIAAGASNREIAAQLVITERTVKTHVTHILRKLNVSSRTQAAARARDWRVV